MPKEATALYVGIFHTTNFYFDRHFIFLISFLETS